MTQFTTKEKTYNSINYTVFFPPGMIAFLGVAVMVALGWLYLGVMVTQMVPLMDMADAGPGMSVFNRFSQWAELDDFGRAVLASLCGPGVLALTTGGDFDIVGSVGYLSAMWVAMSVAMMLPTAVPMIAAYVQICDTARAKSIEIVSPLVLVAGYVIVWLMFAVLAAGAQTALISFSALSPAMVTTHQGIASVLLVGAGLYQFTSLKQACLTKCRTPLNFFFANWSDKTGDIFKLGLRQGLFCLGCCWALMLVMFVAGIMNVIWMVLLTILMVAEKTVPEADWLRRFTGFALIAWGVFVACVFVFDINVV